MECFHGNVFCELRWRNKNSETILKIHLEAQTCNQAEPWSGSSRHFHQPAAASCCRPRPLWQAWPITAQWDIRTMDVGGPHWLYYLDRCVVAFMLWWLGCYSDSQHVCLCAAFWLVETVQSCVWMWMCVFIQDGLMWDHIFIDIFRI